MTSLYLRVRNINFKRVPEFYMQLKYLLKKLNGSFFLIVLSLYLCSGIKSAYSSEPYYKDWTVATIIGSVSDKSSFKYYLEPQLRLIDTSSVFNQLLLLGGFGYQFNKDMMLFVGPGLVVTKTTAGDTFYEQRYWEQFNWRIQNNLNWNINSRTRLEERKNATTAPIAFRLRERMWIRVPLKKWEGYSFSCFDEIFFNLNHPDWVSPYSLEQNRVFVGVSRQLSKSTILDVGYLNQFIHSTRNQMDHVLLLSFTVTT
jgi:hypothetical protein